jgi:pilus assembly protein Flp/PilA
MLKQLFLRFRHDQAGATAIEYALIAAFIAGVITASVAALGGSLLEKYDLVVGLFP